MFNIKIADLIIGIDNKFEFVKNMCSGYLVDDTEKTDFNVYASEDDIINEREISNQQFSDGYLESVCIYRNIAYLLPKYNAFLFHAALISVDKEAYAFTAKSGVGKSTHIKLWKKLLGDKVSIINGDKPILREQSGKVYAYGTPWCGKEGFNLNEKAPLKAICFLERGEFDEIAPLPKNIAAVKIVHQIIAPKSKYDAVKVLDMLDSLLKKVDVWSLKCTMNITAAEVSYNAMKGRQNYEN